MKKKTSLLDLGKCFHSSGCCSSASAMPRREFMKLSTLGATALAFPFMGCEPVSYTSTGHLIPADKMLSAKWIKSLTERGIAEVFSSKRDELKYVGMPIGGVGCGQLYISGDGRLWLWDIFQSNYEREGPAEEKWRLDQFTMGGLYSNPRTSRGNDIHSVEQGVAIRVKEGAKAQILTLDDQGFDQIEFRGEYPIARVNYRKTAVPIEAQLTAFSPFIPLNVKDSAIPATILRHKITNSGIDKVEVTIGSWLENKVCPESSDPSGIRWNEAINVNGKATVFMSAAGDELEKSKGWGNMALSLIGEDTHVNTFTKLEGKDLSSLVFDRDNKSDKASALFSDSLIGGINTSFTLEPEESKTVDFLVSWYFPYYNEYDPQGEQMNKIEDFAFLHRYYKINFSSAEDVADYVAKEFNRLFDTTILWNETWYGSTLPHWFLDRSFISLDCLASQTSHLFDNGRFWGWEGVDCCQGTCTHVWQYAQGMARIFPSFEKDLRQHVDYGIAYHEKGSISYRAENIDSYTGHHFAMDGQLGTIIRIYREHQMSSDFEFLNRLWPKVRRSMQFIIDQDKDGDGLLEGQQPHTLDAAWYGPMGWISGMYLAALKSCEQMALELGDKEFATKCSTIIPLGRKNMVNKLFNGEYFIHLPPDYSAINTNKGCHIDQVLGQSFAHQVNLPGVLPEKETISALAALWKYNFAPDAGQYAIDHTTIKGNRTYVLPGEAGLMMTTWPTGGDDKAVPGMADRPNDKEHWIGPGGYFDECMNGFEYQVASHMVWEGMLAEGLSIMKAIHQRYGASKRNPYDEVECSSHYSRSMASYGVFLAACGYHYHGPKGELGFAPKISPEDFKCAFTVAEGWGTFTQKITYKELNSTLEIAYGSLKLNMLSLASGSAVKKVSVKVNGNDVEVNGKEKNGRYDIALTELLLNTGDKLKATIQYE